VKEKIRNFYLGDIKGSLKYSAWIMLVFSIFQLFYDKTIIKYVKSEIAGVLIYFVFLPTLKYLLEKLGNRMKNEC
jgi:hypothetical protein